MSILPLSASAQAQIRACQYQVKAMTREDLEDFALQTYALTKRQNLALSQYVNQELGLEQNEQNCSHPIDQQISD